MSKTQIYLITPPIDDPDGFAPLLRATIERTRATSVLLRLASTDERTAVNRIKILSPVAQALGAAALVEDDQTMAARGGADGVHINGGIEQARAAIERMKPDCIVGCGELRTRHAAMEAGEAGADYVMFGEPRPTRAGAEAAPPFSLVLEQAAWWANLFEIPCVAYAPTAEAAEALKETGVEFIALGPWAFQET